MTKSGEFSQQATQDAAWDDHCDLLVAGSGAAGLAAALAAAAGGLKVILAEKSGWIWAPCNPVARRHGFDEDSSGPRQYLKAVQGNAFDPALVDAFLQAAPQMIGFLEDRGLAFECGARIPDTYGHLPGAIPVRRLAGTSRCCAAPCARRHSGA